jgi:23S rRNA (adenine2503-C2)-methyltransferase
VPYQTEPELLSELVGDDPPYRADQLRSWLYSTPVMSPGAMTNLPGDVRDKLGESHWPFSVEAELHADSGATRKWLFRAPDGASIETVVMGYPRRTTICISSQAGCAMGCTFCATGQFGFERHLTAGEIVAQVAFANASLAERPLTEGRERVTGIVFMGMGEPLANYKHVRESIRRLVEFVGLSPRNITVSTVGVVPAIYRLADEPWPLNLAVSLHAADDETRTSIVPLNKRYPIRDLTEACASFFEKTGRRVSIEWTLIADTNDSLDQAKRLAAIAIGMSAHVNVIPLNPTPLSADQAPTKSTVNRFVKALKAAGVNVTVRNTRGRDIDAACGQLRTQFADAE